MTLTNKYRIADKSITTTAGMTVMDMGMGMVAMAIVTVMVRILVIIKNWMITK